MLPPSLDEMLEAGHPARFAAEFVDALDDDGWTAIGVDKDGEPMGAPAYHPRVLLGVWLYGFMTGVRSSRKLEAACRDQIPYLWLTGCQRPDHVTLWRFYNRHRDGSNPPCRRIEGIDELTSRHTCFIDELVEGGSRRPKGPVQCPGHPVGALESSRIGGGVPGLSGVRRVHEGQAPLPTTRRCADWATG